MKDVLGMGMEFAEERESRTTSRALQVANPAPLGLASFAVTTFTLSVFNAGLLPVRLERVAIPLAYFYGGSIQLLAGLVEFLARNTFGATAFCSYGAFWLAFAYYVTAVLPTMHDEQAHAATGLFLLTWTIFTAYMTVASMRTFRALTFVFAFLTLTFCFLTIGEWGEVDSCKKAGGYLGIITSILAWYCSFGLMLLETWKEEVLPLVFYRHKSR